MMRSLVLAVSLTALMGVAAPSLAAVLVYDTPLSGSADQPPASPGTGFAQLDYDDTAHTMRVQASFTGLVGNTSISHIHGPTAVPFTGTAGVITPTPTFPGFPSGVTAGVYDITLDLTLASSWNPTYINNNGGSPASAESAFVAALAAGKTYLNIHTSTHPSGEIRGFFELVPEPASLGLVAVGALATLRRRRSPR